MTEDDAITATANAVVGELVVAGKTLATAESCTGGWIAKALTDVAGSSRCFGYGVVSYANGAKESLLGVNPATLNEYGAVSEEVVTEMAEGALSLSGADYAVAVSGVAGPDGGSEEKPLGSVWIGWATRAAGGLQTEAGYYLLAGDRAAIRSATVVRALQGIRERLKKGG